MGMPPALTYAQPLMSNEPIVRVSVEGMKFQYQLTEDDIHKVFRRYGTVTNVNVDEACSSAMVTFQNAQDAQAAINDLDGKVLNGLDGTLRISWISGSHMSAPPYSPMPGGSLGGFPPVASLPLPCTGPAGAPPASFASMPDSSGGQEGRANSKGAQKYTCRFLIGIENDKEFQVARRLIGAKGSNMKHIVKQTEAKLRLRGQGSGYFEGAGQKESPEPLQLCISCTSPDGYKTAVRQVEELLKRVHDEYRQFCMENGRPVPDLRINLSENQLIYSSRAGAPGGGAVGLGVVPSGPGNSAVGGGGGGGSGGERRRGPRRGGGGAKVPLESGDRGEPGPNSPSVEEIQVFINERNEARRTCNFSEADRIRDLLHSRGVALMDEPGGRGRGAEVTSWRYWRD